ncbi:hypothetical protein ymoll0001_25440 [Yersinia mollaretii ATCC 43969]|uniref:Uncharacterized protein n=1 Tax=Yersinia mollaretii (strain ATCC 43969 / DSM 18520 / CIP 103324 / CNY 7263 / WAIP 204) TaxID=349967 RepID=A0ABM9YDW1_YERMW|nr:hypothetical protein ymoll0001_25440 [Yersinia mollaretii ATCC 43969]
MKNRRNSAIGSVISLHWLRIETKRQSRSPVFFSTYVSRQTA